MSDADYIVVINWERFQHYKDRSPPWIKTYTELLASDAYLRLTGNRRAILHGLWLDYATKHGELPHDTVMISRRLSLKVTTADLCALEDAGFIALPSHSRVNGASESLARRYQSASASRALARDRDREETETQDQDQTRPVPNPGPQHDAQNGTARHGDDIVWTKDLERL
jgi:hypothetical protein